VPTLLNPGAEGEQVLHSKAIYPLAHGDLVSLRVSGSGGYGDPRERDPDLVARDVALGYVSVKQARQGYGVVIDPASGAVDAGATARLRHTD
jgi:N-methylhydantoinase B